MGGSRRYQGAHSHLSTGRLEALAGTAALAYGAGQGAAGPVVPRRVQVQRRTKARTRAMARRGTRRRLGNRAGAAARGLPAGNSVQFPPGVFGTGLDDRDYLYIPESQLARARLEEEGILPMRACGGSSSGSPTVMARQPSAHAFVGGADSRLEPELQRTARQFSAGTEVARLREALQLSRDSLATSNAFIQSTAGDFMAERLDERLGRRRAQQGES